MKKSTGQSFRLECKFGRITGWWLFLFFAVLHLLQTQRTGIKHLVVGVPVAHEAWKVHNLTLNTVKSNKCWTVNIHNLKKLQISLSIYLVVLLNGPGYAISCISTEKKIFETLNEHPQYESSLFDTKRSYSLRYMFTFQLSSQTLPGARLAWSSASDC